MRPGVLVLFACFLLGGGALVRAGTPEAPAHGGGLDALGCHHDRGNGGYHCHRGTLGGKSFASREEAEAALPTEVHPEPPAGPDALSDGLSAGDPEWRTVVRAIDGDTILLDGGERVRLIGVDTPESVDPRRPVGYFGREASAFTASLVAGRRVRCVYDGDRRDAYGRTLAYVYLEGGTFLNAEIVRQGFGFAYTRFPFRYLEEFRRYEREARAAGRGLWAQP